MLSDGPIKRDIARSAEFRKRIVQVAVRASQVGSREIAAAALYETTAEHHSAIGLLLHFKRFSSAQALIRSCVEVSLRTVWLLQCATQEQVENIQNKSENWPGLEEIIGKIEGFHRRGGFIRKLIPPRSFLNDLTHGGFMQIADRLLPAAAKLDSRIPEHELMREHIAAFCIRTTDRMLCLACAAIHIELGDPEAATEMNLLYEETVKSYESGRRPTS
jgi:hypothetical protein